MSQVDTPQPNDPPEMQQTLIPPVRTGSSQSLSGDLKQRGLRLAKARTAAAAYNNFEQTTNYWGTTPSLKNNFLQKRGPTPHEVCMHYTLPKAKPPGAQLGFRV